MLLFVNISITDLTYAALNEKLVKDYKANKGNAKFDEDGNLWIFGYAKYRSMKDRYSTLANSSIMEK